MIQMLVRAGRRGVGGQAWELGDNTGSGGSKKERCRVRGMGLDGGTSDGGSGNKRHRGVWKLNSDIRANDTGTSESEKERWQYSHRWEGEGEVPGSKGIRRAKWEGGAREDKEPSKK